MSIKRDYNKLLSEGNEAQLEKLMANNHKKGFDKVTLEYAFKRLVEELSELQAEIIREQVFGYKLDWKAVKSESADIANFAHMIIYACNREIEKENGY